MSFRSARRAMQIAFQVGCLATPALAVDLQVKSSASETLEANDNYFLLPAPRGITYAPLDAASLDVLAQAPTTRYGFHGDLAYYRYLGDGGQDASRSSAKQSNVSLSLDQDGKVAGDKMGLTAWSQQQDVATAQLNDIGAVTAGGEASTLGVGGTLRRQPSAIDSLMFSASGTRVDFSSASAVPYSNLTTGATWRRQLGPTTELLTSTEFNWTIADDVARSDVKFWKVVAGVSSKLTPRLKLIGSVGIGIVSSGRDRPGGLGEIPLGGGLAFGSTGTFASSGSSATVIADAQAIYELRKTTEISFDASRSIAPDVLGALSERMNYGVGLTQAINSASSVSFAGAFTQSAASSGPNGSGASAFWTANASYNRSLSREWRAQLGYNYRRRDDGGGSVSSNAVTISLVRDVTLLP